MNLLLRRTEYLPNGTPGQLFVNQEPFCATLERAKDDLYHPCIPAGKYVVLISWSNRRKRLMPFLLDVPGRTGIEIHSANLVSELLGCIAVGEKFLEPSPVPGELFLYKSIETFNALYPQLEAAQESGISIEILDAGPSVTAKF